MCYNTFAIWYCEEEALHLCARCNDALHQWSNKERVQHTRRPIAPKIGLVPLSVGLFCSMLWQSYRLTLIPTLTGLFKWLNVGDYYCDGAPPGDGYCSQYLVSDSSVDANSSDYWLMFGMVITMIVFWAIVVPLMTLLLLAVHHRRLHQDRILAHWGWIYHAYNWKACYWETIIVWRKFLLVLVAELQRIGVYLCMFAFSPMGNLLHCSALQYSAMQGSTVRGSTVQYITVQYSQYSTVQYSKAQLLPYFSPL